MAEEGASASARSAAERARLSASATQASPSRYLGSGRATSTGTATCCTAECHVLGTGAPKWALIDPTNPSGGVTATFAPVPVDVDNDPFWCPAESSGSMEPRSITYNVFCATKNALTAVEAPKMDNYCTVHMNFTSPTVC